jgi:hypothetical protein
MPNFDPNSMAAYLVCTFCLVALYNQIMQAVGKRKTEQPFIISMEKRFVSHEDHDKHASYVEGKLVTAALSRKKIHETQEAHGTRIARLEEQNKSQTDSLQLLSSDSREFYRDQRSFNNEILKRLPKD